MTELIIHALLDESRCNGPGVRKVIWVQGCSLDCVGCFNPETHAVTGGYRKKLSDLLAWLDLGSAYEGVTISGGEPFQQPEALLALLRRIRQFSHGQSGHGQSNYKSIVVFSGFSLEEIGRMKWGADILSLIDVLVAGRYREELCGSSAGEGLLGSMNQQLHYLSERYKPEDFQQIPHSEIHIAADGQYTITGIAPPKPLLEEV